MLHRFHDRFGTAGVIIAIIALVAALGGTALAAKGALTGKQKKEVEKIAKKFAGEDGATGPIGSQGAPGAKGDPGSPGLPGVDGVDGEDGKSVVLGAPTVGECPQGGATVEVEGSGTKKPLCNGQTGFTVTLPSGRTETGSWGGAYLEGSVVQPISFAIPLAETPNAVFVGKSAEEIEEGEEEGCLGLESDGTPTAEPGTLCVYLGETVGTIGPAAFLDPTAPTQFAEGAAPSGTELFFECQANPCLTFGTWAVTAQ